VSRFIFGPLATSPDLYDTLVSNLAYYELRSEVSRFLLDPSTTSPYGLLQFGYSSILILPFQKYFATLELVLELPHV
jgi:hypothetical protein